MLAQGGLLNGQSQHRAGCRLFRHQAINTAALQCGINRIGFLFPPGHAYDGGQLCQFIERDAQ